MRFFNTQRNKVFVSAAQECVATAALLYVAAKSAVEDSPYESILDTVERELVQSQYVQVFFRLGSVTMGMTINIHNYTNSAIATMQSRFMQGLSFTLNGKPLRSCTLWSDYGVTEGSTIFCHPRVLGGMSGSPTEITYKDVDVTVPKYEGVDPLNGEWVDYVSKRSLSCDLFKASQRLAKKTRQRHKTYEIQALETRSSYTGIKSFLDAHVDVDVLSLVEDLSLLIVQLVRAPCLVDSSLAVITFLKLRTGGSLICNLADMIEMIVSDIAGPTIQAEESGDDLLEKVTDFRQFLNNWDAIKDSSLVKRSTRLFRYAAAVGICAQVGIKLDEKTLKACKSEADGIFAGPNFLCALLDTIALLLQRSLMFAKTGKWETFFHGPKSYGKWYDSCMELKRQYVFIGNLEAHGTNYHSFIKELSDSIETGKAILKFGEKATGFELAAIKKLLNEMLMIHASVLTYTSAQQSRRPPFAMLVHGGSAVCKSTFVDMLFNYMGQVLNLPTSGDYKYTRSPSDPFWSGWNSAKWFITLDDVAYIAPDSAFQDLSLMEIIQLVNDVPFVPNQAALEDKGKNPVRARVVIATTNTKHLNAAAHFACPLAVQRRLPFVTTISPKREYARTDAPEMLDPVKLPLITSDWPDFWSISVDKVIPAGGGMATYENVGRFNSIVDYLDWLRLAMEIFQEVQTKATLGCQAMGGFKVCMDCNRVVCICSEVQNCEEDDVSSEVSFNLSELGDPMPGDELADPPVTHPICGRARLGYTLPEGAIFGQHFVREIVEDARTFRYEYSPCNKPESNYILKTTVLENGMEVRKHFTELNVTSVNRPKSARQTEEVDMADVLAAIVEQQKRRVDKFHNRLVKSTIRWYLQWYMSSKTVRHYTHQAMDWKCVRSIAAYAVSNSNYGTKSAFVLLGNAAMATYTSPRWRMVLKGLAVAAALATTYVVVNKVRKAIVTPDKFECSAACHDDGYTAGLKSVAHIQKAVAEEYREVATMRRKEADRAIKLAEQAEMLARDEEDELEPQGLRLSVADSAFAKTEKENVWKRDDYETSSFDLTPVNVSYASLPYDQLMQIVNRNVARIKVSNGVKAREGNALCVGGHLWVTNNHTFYPEGDLQVSMEIVSTTVGLTPNVTMKVRQHEVFRDVANDQVWFLVLCWSPKRDLRDLIRKPTLKGKYRGAYTGYTKLRQKQEIPVAAIQFAVSESDLGAIPGWCGYAQAPTVLGDCGMPLVVHKPHAAIIGLHMLGNQLSEVWATALDTDKVAAAMAHFERPIVQCGVPRISAPSKEKCLGPLRQWSPLRWVEKGSVEAYGSFTGYQATPRSRVQPTLLGEIIKKDRGWTVDAVRPELKDFRPWRHALLDVTNQQYGAIDRTKLRTCAKAYVNDVLAALPKEALKDLQVISNTAAINGIEGVKFIDKMNFKSSMGEPYCKTKKDYLVGPDGEKMFIDEVNERIVYIENCYAEGRRACPVFSGQLKDEARSAAKVAEGMIRAFSGAPADWSLVVRKYLLTSVKVIQENPFVFEASPGCAAQTLAWEQYYDFLTEHGADRMIAGDYGKFDKKMEPQLILEAFWILAELLRAAGWSEEELLVVHCIAEDVAFAFVNFNGDLLAFFGSNPSGHPLTVIINCLVNALYMRYCFLELHPGVEDDATKVARFKAFVNLLTYGDDNVLNVKRGADWFNHTAIQKVLASIGVKYTMADKESVSRPFIHIREVSYLKRTWRWVEEIGAIVCPLDEASIKKMLTVCIPSGTESPQFHMASVMSSAINEWFWYGRDTFEKERAWLWQLAVTHGITQELVAKSFPTWNELCIRFEKSSEGMTTKRTLGCVVAHPRTVVPN